MDFSSTELKARVFADFPWEGVPGRRTTECTAVYSTGMMLSMSKYRALEFYQLLNCYISGQHGCSHLPNTLRPAHHITSWALSNHAASSSESRIWSHCWGAKILTQEEFLCMNILTHTNKHTHTLFPVSIGSPFLFQVRHGHLSRQSGPGEEEGCENSLFHWLRFLLTFPPLKFQTFHFHRMVWVGMDHKDHLAPTLLPCKGTPSIRPCCSKPCPTSSWTALSLDFFQAPFKCWKATTGSPRAPGWRTPCLSGCLQIRAPDHLHSPPLNPLVQRLSQILLIFWLLYWGLQQLPATPQKSLSQSSCPCHWNCRTLTSTVSDVFSSQTQHNFGSWMGITCLLHQHHVFPPPAPTLLFVCLF